MNQFSDPPLLINGFSLLIKRIAEAFAVVHKKKFAARRNCPAQRLQLGQIRQGRLIDKKMFAARQHLHGQRAAIGINRGGGDQIHRGIVENGFSGSNGNLREPAGKFLQQMRLIDRNTGALTARYC